MQDKKGVLASRLEEARQEGKAPLDDAPPA